MRETWDDGFGVAKRTRKDFEEGVSEFKLCHESITIDKYSCSDSVEFMDL